MVKLEMNERIKELAFEAAGGMLSYDGEDEWRLSQKEAEKFAELIVRETVKEMSDQLYWHGEVQSNNPSFYKAIEKTLKHFGVDE